MNIASLGRTTHLLIGKHELQKLLRSSALERMMAQILSKYQGEKHPALIILLGQEAWAAYLSQRDEMQVIVPVMCSLASRNVMMLPGIRLT